MKLMLLLLSKLKMSLTSSSIIHSGERLKLFLQDQEYSPIIYRSTRFLGQNNQVRTRNKIYLHWKGTMKLSLFSNNMIFYAENTNDSTKKRKIKLLEFILSLKLVKNSLKLQERRSTTATKIKCFHTLTMNNIKRKLRKQFCL